ncbi:MAG TPA: type I secretion system permease/ATPase [Alphaproteobacteria bacterium]|nr:type I secretion system permease/ATPase [Alphaproteobacteria bacterium]
MSLALRTARQGFLMVGVFSLFLNLLMLVSPIYMMQVFDRVLSSGRTETLLYLTVIAAMALIVLAALEALRSTVLNRISGWLDRQLGSPLIASSLASALRGSAQGAQPLRDLSQIRSFIGGNGILPLFDAPWAPVFILILWWMHPWLGALALGAAIVLFGLALANDLTTRRALKEANHLSVAAYGQAEAAVRNAEVVQAMGLLPALLGRWRDRNAVVLERQSAAAERSALIVGCSKFTRLFVQIAILGVGAYLVLEAELTAGGMIAGSILLGRALAPVEQAIGAWKSLVSARTSYDRLQSLLQATPEKPAAMRLPEPRGDLAVEKLVFVPPRGTKPVLKQVSFELPAGQSMGIIGPSAAGKSTLCRLLVGTWPPSAGNVRLDSADVHSWDREDFGRHVGYLPQDVELFAGTVKDNIARMGEATDEDVVAAARLANVHELILNLPDGYETEIGDQGAVLSGGQRQRIGLARALFGNPKLLVLDEPNANLDSEGEAALTRTIAALKERGTTIVMVAHRPSILAHIDKLLVLRDGMVEMFGARDQVLERFGRPRPVESGQSKPALSAQFTQKAV